MKYYFVSYSFSVNGFGSCHISDRSKYFDYISIANHIEKSLEVPNPVILYYKEISEDEMNFVHTRHS